MTDYQDRKDIDRLITLVDRLLYMVRYDNTSDLKQVATKEELTDLKNLLESQYSTTFATRVQVIEILREYDLID